MPEVRWSAVLFDLDGTLADDMPLVIGGYQHALSTVMGTEPDWQEARRVFGTPLIDTLRSEAPADKVDQLYAVYRDYLAAHLADLCRPVAGLATAIHAFAGQGIKMGVVTSLPRSIAAMILETVGLPNMPVLATLETTPHLKPAPDGLLAALLALDTAAPDAAYVGDSIHDIEAAKAAGVASIAVTWGASLRADLAAQTPEAVVDSPADLTTLVLG